MQICLVKNAKICDLSKGLRFSTQALRQIFIINIWILPSIHYTDFLRLLPRTQLHTIAYSFLPFIWGKRPTGEATLHFFFFCFSSHLNRTLG